MEQQNVQVLWNDRLNPSCYKIGLRTSDSFLAAIPGQFIMLHVADRMDPLLRRPFSIHKLITRPAKVQGIELLYKVVGAGTEILSQFRGGDRVNILGPLAMVFMLPITFKAYLLLPGASV